MTTLNSPIHPELLEGPQYEINNLITVGVAYFDDDVLVLDEEALRDYERQVFADKLDDQLAAALAKRHGGGAAAIARETALCIAEENETAARRSAGRCQ